MVFYLRENVFLVSNMHTSSRLCWETQQPYCDRMYGCAILEELDYLCNLSELKVQPHASSSDKDTSSSQN